MTAPAEQPAADPRTARFGRLVERDDGADFPYYRDAPPRISAGQWLLVVAACAVGFAVLALTPQPDDYLALVPRILFAAVPLTVLALVAARSGRSWRALFRPVHGRDVLTVIAFAALNLAVTSVLALIVRALFGATANSATQGLDQLSAGELTAFYLGTGVQLLGEELFTILPFLAVLTWLHTRTPGRTGVPRTRAVLVAWLVTAIWFGAAHLPTYGWNLAQALVVIGGARLVLTLAYLRTKNLAVCTGAHVLNDWSTFTFALLTSGTAAGAASAGT
ncbi:CPBP family intramembrane glutamic endopeptidase [Kineococcus sp. SYSU DK005]|uniref:CPBP family intramembrane glutamic endopeptidase n=1 Tax=Kineococcus sp. SYSU DK005 TaxID=3383126 RepID=UPI003D7DA68B